MDDIRCTTEITHEPKNEDFSEFDGEVKELTVEEQIELKCDEYGIPSDIPLAIAKLETGHFTSRAYKEGNNVGGMSIDEQPISYETLEEGVEAFVENLAENYFEEGLDTPEEIGEKYCPLQKEHWVNVVNQMIGEEQ